MMAACRAALLIGFIACLLVAATGCAGSNETPASGTPPVTNLVAMERLASRIGEEVLARYSADIGPEVVLDVDSSGSSWIVRGALIKVLAGQNRKVFLKTQDSPGGATRWNIRGPALSVSYDNIRKPGFFAGAVVDRTIRVALYSEILNGPAVGASEHLEKAYSDTLPADTLPEVENPPVPYTKGAMPELNSFDRYIEPFVIIGATGAAIFLFFQVRS